MFSIQTIKLFFISHKKLIKIERAWKDLTKLSIIHFQNTMHVEEQKALAACSNKSIKTNRDRRCEASNGADNIQLRVKYESWIPVHVLHCFNS